MTVQLSKRLLTVAEYYKMAEVGILTAEDRVELINGEIINMSPINSLHSGCVNKLIAFFSKHFTGKVVVAAQNPVHLDEFSEPEPDLAILKLRADYYSESHPKPEDVLILIEVADSSIEKDQQVKIPLYAKSAIPEVWIVNLSAKCIEIHTQPQADNYTSKIVFQIEDTIEKEWVPGLKVKDIV